MAKIKYLTYEESLTNALKKMPQPLIDKKHNLKIYLNNDRARSNQSRFEHIVDDRHGIKVRDIERIPRHLKKCIFKKDLERTETYNIYIRRSSISDQYIKISVKIDPREPNVAIIKTIFITKIIK